MNVLFLSHVRDSAASNGGMVYSNQLLALLRRVCDRVDVLYVYDTPPKLRKFRILIALCRSLFIRIPAKVLYFDRSSTRSAIARLTAAAPPDVVIFDHLETVVYLPAFADSLTPVLIQHNDEATLYEQRLDKMRGVLSSALCNAESRKLRHFQDKASFKIKNKVFISPDELDRDAEGLQKGNRISLLPTFDYPVAAERTTKPGDPIHIAFLGNMRWWPNRDAVEWLLEKVIPHLNDGITVHLMGLDSDSEHFRRKNTVCHGFVNNAADIWKQADIFVAPIVSGAGLNVKVAEAIYNRKSIISTARGVRGIPLESDTAIVIADNPDEWISVLNNPLKVAQLNATPPLSRNSSLFDRNASVLKLKTFLEKCQ